MAESRERVVDYTVLPAPVKPEDMRTSQEVRPLPESRSEHERETEFVLRTTGMFI